MKQKRKGLGKRLKWRLEWGAFLALERLLSLVPMRPLWSVGAVLGHLPWILSSRRRIVESNLRTVLGPEVDDTELRRVTRDVFRHNTANLLCSLKAAHMSLEALREVITFEDPEVFRNAVATGRGVTVILSHMGNWELLAQIGSLFIPGAKASAMYRPLNNPYMDRLVAERRRAHGMELFAKKDSVKGPLRFLREGGAVTVLADQRSGLSGTLSPLFGRLMSVTPLPTVVQRRTGCEIIGVSMRTVAPGQWVAKAHPLRGITPAEFTPAHMTKLIEEIYRESIPDAFWFQDLWRRARYAPLAHLAKRGPLVLEADRDRPLVPTTILVRPPDDDEAALAAIPALQTLLASRPDLALVLSGPPEREDFWRAQPVPHRYHCTDGSVVPDADFALALTRREVEARDLVRAFEGQVYALPGVTQEARPNWWTVEADDDEGASWLPFLRALGMHEPPLEVTYA